MSWKFYLVRFGDSAGADCFKVKLQFGSSAETDFLMLNLQKKSLYYEYSLSDFESPEDALGDSHYTIIVFFLYELFIKHMISN